MFSSSDYEEGNGAEGGDAGWWQGTPGSFRPGERSRRMNGGIGGLSSNSSRLTSRRSSIPCKFYSQPSGCASGKHCKFSHGPTLSGSASFNNLLALGGGLEGGIGERTSSPSRGERGSDGGGPRTPCRFHLRGYCRTGRKCPFLHIGPAGAGGERGGEKATSSLGHRSSDGGHYGSPKHGSNLAEHHERKGHNTDRVLGRSISAGFLLGLAGGPPDREPLTISQSGRMYNDDIDEDGLEGEIDGQHRSLMGERQASQRLRELQAALERQLFFDNAAEAHVNSSSTTPTAEREGGEEEEGGYFVEGDGQGSRRVVTSSAINTLTSCARSLPVTPKSKAAALGGLSRGDGATIDENEIKSMAMSAMEGFGLTSALTVSAVSPGRKKPARSQSHHSLYLLGSPSSRSNSHFSPGSHFSVGSPTALDLSSEAFVHVPSGLSNNVTESRAGVGGGLGERVSSFHSLDGALSTYGGSNNLHQQHHNNSSLFQQHQQQPQPQQQGGGGQRSGAPGGGSHLPASFLRIPQQSSSTQGPFRGPLYSYGSSNSLAGLVEGEDESEVDSLNNGGARNHSLLGVGAGGGGGGVGAGYNSFCATRGGSTLSLFSLHEGCDDDDDHGDHDFLYGEGDATGLPLIEVPLPTYNQQHQNLFQSSSSNQLRAKPLSNGGFPSSSSLATQEEVYFYGAPGALTSAESAMTIVGGGGGYPSSVSPPHHQLLSNHSSYQQQQQQQLSSALSSSSLSSLGTSGLVRTSSSSLQPQGVRWAEIVTTTGSDSGSGGSLTPQRLMMYPAATSSSSSTSISTLATTPPLSTSSSLTGIRRSSSSNQLSTSASSTTINSSRELKICRFFLQGNCVHGMRCRNSHNVNVALTVSSQDLDRGADPPRTMEEIRALDEQEIRRSTNAECHICTEIVTGRFGLLTDCPHAFCLKCIRTWRQQHMEGQESSNVRSCPLCKQISHFVIPHTRHVTDPIRKDNLIREYKAQMGKKRCKYYQDGEECPFGTSCFYAHLNPDGTPAEPPKIRTRMGAEGNIEVVQEVKLSQFFDLRRG